MTTAVDRLARAIRCERCGAAPGQPCRQPDHHAAAHSHVARTRPVAASLALAHAVLGRVS